MPESRLPAKSENLATMDRQPGKRGLPVVRGKLANTLSYFLEFDPERVVHLQSPGDLCRNVDTSGPASIAICFLQENQVAIRLLEEFRDLF
jgi:hypothetical protein